MSKWVVTGTPIENSINDLFSFVHFLNYEPWNEKKMWDKIIAKPLFQKKDYSALINLNKIIQPIILRRTKKGSANQLNLQEMKEYEEFVHLNADERYAYDQMADQQDMNLEEIESYQV